MMKIYKENLYFWEIILSNIVTNCQLEYDFQNNK